MLLSIAPISQSSIFILFFFPEHVKYAKFPFGKSRVEGRRPPSDGDDFYFFFLRRKKKGLQTNGVRRLV